VVFFAIPGVEEQTKAGISLWRYLSRYKKFIDYSCSFKCIFFQTGKSRLLDVNVHDYLLQLNILNTINVTNSCEKIVRGKSDAVIRRSSQIVKKNAKTKWNSHGFFILNNLGTHDAHASSRALYINCPTWPVASRLTCCRSSTVFTTLVFLQHA